MSVAQLYSEYIRSSRPAALRTLWILLAGILLPILPHAACDAAEQSHVYTIGTDNSFPYHALNANGSADGMSAEVIQEASRRSGVRLQWVLRPEGPQKALSAKAVDIWPLLAVQPNPWPDFHFTAPYLTNTYVGVTLDPALATPAGLKNVRRAAVVHYYLVTKVTRSIFPHAEIVARATRADAMAAMCAGTADMMVTEARTLQALALDRPASCADARFHTIGMDTPPVSLAIASTKEAAAAAETLRDEIEKMLADGSMARILRRWNYFYGGEAELRFREHEAQQAEGLSLRLSAALGILSILLLFLLFFFSFRQPR